MRLGVFGGSFDPVHNGHLELARVCRGRARLDEVWFVPAAQQPHKPSGPVASNADRVQMLRLATAGETGLEVSTLEIDRGGVSYTVDTLRQIAAERPHAELFFLMGADTLRDLPKWREPGEVLRLATPIVVHRAGEPAPDFGGLRGLATPAQIAVIRDLVVETTPIAVSSSELRGRLAAGAEAGDALPRRVADWIAEKGVYHSA